MGRAVRPWRTRVSMTNFCSAGGRSYRYVIPNGSVPARRAPHDNPLANPECASHMGMPGNDAPAFDWIMSGKLAPGASVSRWAPAPRASSPRRMGWGQPQAVPRGVPTAQARPPIPFTCRRLRRSAQIVGPIFTWLRMELLYRQQDIERWQVTPLKTWQAQD